VLNDFSFGLPVSFIITAERFVRFSYNLAFEHNYVRALDY
jgi:hypothetical protein